MFTAVSPQVAKHLDGYTVQVVDRETVGYQDDSCHATVKVEFGPITSVYVDSLEIVCNENASDDRTPDRARIIGRIRSGMSFLGITFEIVE